MKDLPLVLSVSVLFFAMLIQPRSSISAQTVVSPLTQYATNEYEDSETEAVVIDGNRRI